MCMLCRGEFLECITLKCEAERRLGLFSAMPSEDVPILDLLEHRLAGVIFLVYVISRHLMIREQEFFQQFC